MSIRDEFIYQVDLLINIINHVIKNNKLKDVEDSDIKYTEKILNILTSFKKRIDDDLSCSIIEEVRNLDSDDMNYTPLKLGQYLEIVQKLLINLENLTCESNELIKFLPILHSIYITLE